MLAWLHTQLIRSLLCVYPGTAYSPSSPVDHFSDNVSPIYPDRPIRPLPKRRLRSRLSPETASSILYPTAPHAIKPLFCLPFKGSASFSEGSSLNGAANNVPAELGPSPGARSKNSKNGYYFKGNDLDSDEEDSVGIVRRYQEQRQAMASLPRIFADGSTRMEIPKYAKPLISQSPISSLEGIDGYDSFENTNNKKKRKIPTSGSLGNHHSTLSTGMAHMGISSNHDIDALHADLEGGVGQYYGTGNSALPANASGTGISGAGRGRFGRAGVRSGSGRSPLGVSVNGSNNLQISRTAAQRRDYTPSANLRGKGSQCSRGVTLATADAGVEVPSMSDQGIISAAIANAAALPTTPSNGKENMGLLEQQFSRKTTSSKTQFTFTCESDSAKTLAWSGQHDLTPVIPYQAATPANAVSAQNTQNHRGVATQGTQTSPSMAGQADQAAPLPNGVAQQNTQQDRKPRRPPAKQYALAARQRRLRQDYNNYQHPPSSEDTWICEFCEYESIFGSPPEALVRQYEIKDRRERRRLAEKRRLLEKAKMKGRKGKKGNKTAAKSTSVATEPQQTASKTRHDHHPEDQGSAQHRGTQSEDYLADDYDDDLIPGSTMPTHTPTKVPESAADDHVQGLRSASGTETSNMKGKDVG